jgi:hypothetical protein
MRSGTGLEAWRKVFAVKWVPMKPPCIEVIKQQLLELVKNSFKYKNRNINIITVYSSAPECISPVSCKCSSGCSNRVVSASSLLRCSLLQVGDQLLHSPHLLGRSGRRCRCGGRGRSRGRDRSGGRGRSRRSGRSGRKSRSSSSSNLEGGNLLGRVLSNDHDDSLGVTSR